MSSPRSHRLPGLMLALAAASALAWAAAAPAADKVEPTGSGPAASPPPAAAMPAIPENAEELKAPQGAAPAPATVTRRPARKLTPMMAEILAYLEARDHAIALRQQQLAAPGAARPDAAAALAAAAEMQRMKQETELEVLAIQARWARREGRTADAQRIEETIEEILRPKVPVNPEVRPAPSTPSR